MHLRIRQLDVTPPGIALAVVIACTSLLAADAPADVYELESGGEIRGALVDRGDDGSYVVRTEGGATIALPRAAIARIVAVDDTLAEYQRRAQSTPDTAEGQRTLARWCEEQGLLDESDVHWQRVLDFAPRDEEALASLDYQRVNGRWLTREELMARRGMIFHDGSYRTAQHIALRERDAAQENVEANWIQKLKLWRDWLDSRRDDRVIAARANLESLDDPNAVPAIIGQLKDERDPWVYGELLKVLARLDHPDSIRTLVDVTLHDPSADMRELALDLLTRDGDRVPILPYVRALRDGSNRVVNRAAKALRFLGDPEAVSPLIDALVTEHKRVIQQGQPGGINAGMVNGGGSFSMGGDGPKVIIQPRNNPAVLQALIELTGQTNLEYDERAWRSWFVNQQERALASARRDN